jgi:hypothetical protein
VKNFDVYCFTLFAIICIQYLLAKPGYAEPLAIPKKIRITSDESSYAFKLVEKSLEISGVRDKYKLIHISKGELSVSRLTRLMSNTEYAEIAPLAVTKSRMKDLRAIRQPLYFGLQGYRILLVHKSNQARFRDVNTLRQLQRLQAGFVNGWADNAILSDNNLPTHMASTSNNVYAMLSHKRVDYFPRSLQEVMNNYQQNVGDYPNLAIEESLALFYQLPVYFFLSKKNEALASQLEAGLIKLKESGELRNLFLEYHQSKIVELNLEKRTVLELRNSSLPIDIVLSPPMEWLTLYYNELRREQFR